MHPVEVFHLVGKMLLDEVKRLFLLEDVGQED